MEMLVDVHEVEEDATVDSRLAACYLEYLLVDVVERLLVVGKLSFKGTIDRVDAPVVENRGATVVTREAFTVHTPLAIFLTSIEHEGVLLHEHRGCEGRNTLAGIGSKKVAGNALLVMILEEVEHVVTNVVGTLPRPADGLGRLLAADDGSQGVVHAYLVVEPVETC